MNRRPPLDKVIPADYHPSMAIQPVVVLDVAGLTPRLLPHAPRLAAVGKAAPMRSPIPAVTCTSQATLLTGESPSRHGIVGNGWLYRDTMEVRFWQQSNTLLQAPPLYATDKFRTAKLFWWFNQGAPVAWTATPKPHYGADGGKAFGIIDATGCELEKNLGPFPFQSFWGPMAGLSSTEWIARAAALILRKNRPDLTLVYLPHLDYDYQRLGPGDPARVAEVDECAGIVLDAANEIGAAPIVVSEYGLVPVSRPVYLNRKLREAGWLAVRDGPFGEMLETSSSKAFAVCDHQVAHIYIRDPGHRLEVLHHVMAIDGVDRVLDLADQKTEALDHSRSGELIALSKPDAWFAYPYWLDDDRAPDFARTVDIHRKPGYDPCELFMTSKFRAMRKVLKKKLGFRTLVDVIPLEASLVKGSHGLRPDPQDGPVCISDTPVNDMRQFKDHLLARLGVRG